jgi:hypothetical protein
MEKEPKVTDEQCFAEWRMMLKMFSDIIQSSPPVDEVRDALKALQTSAKLSDFLTPRQVSGIYDRCENYLKGDYGVTKQHFEVGAKPSKN